LPTPPAFVEASEYTYFGAGQKIGKKPPQTGRHARDFEAYKRRKRREIVRRCTETSLLCGIGAIVWSSSRKGAPELVDWWNELTAFLLLPPLVYLIYPLRLTLRAYAAGKTLLQAVRLGFHIPSQFDPGPLLYPVMLPPMIALSLFQRSVAFLPAAMACGLVSIPPQVTVTPQIPAIGEHVQWLISILPLHSWGLRLFSHHGANTAKPFLLKLGQGSAVTREDLVVIFPLHQALMTVLGYLTTSSLDISELRLLSCALIHLLIFARTPQAEILKATMWLGGLCVFVACKNLLIWQVALARIPNWKFLRTRPRQGLVAQLDQTFCVLVTRGRLPRKRRASSDSDDEHTTVARVRPRLKLQLNGRSSTATTWEPLSALEEPTKDSFMDPPILSKPSRRNTFTMFDRRTGKDSIPSAKKTKGHTRGPSVAFMSLTVEQARVRKYAYAALSYLLVIAIVLGPVRLYVSKRALSGCEPFGWALGYLFDDIPAFRPWVVGNNLEGWICLPPRISEAFTYPSLSVESLRQHVLGPANTRLLVCAYCVLVLLTGIATVLRLTSVVEVDTRRKVFHGIMVAMLLPTIFVDPCFIALALGLILAIFLLLDLFRASQLPPISKPLTTFLAPYVDGRDYRGPVIVSHIFLLIGCAIPLWLSLAAAPRVGEGAWTGWDVLSRDLSMVSGVVCVGMGDAAASLFGRRYGKTKWCWAGGKSFEGSLAFAFAVTCGLSASWLWLRVGGWVPWQKSEAVAVTLGKCVAAGMGASLLESTLTAANDNVVVPVGLWLLVRGLNI
jgi:dolichol kinase